MTPREKEVYQYIYQYVSDYGIFPLLRTVAQNFKISVPTAANHISSLVRKGLLARPEPTKYTLTSKKI